VRNERLGEGSYLSWLENVLYIYRNQIVTGTIGLQ